MTASRPARPWLAALLVGAVTGTHVLLWQTLVEDVACAPGEWCGLLEGIVLIYVGGPVVLVLAWLAFRRAGARSALLGTGALVVALLVLVDLTASLGIPLFAWPCVLAALAALWFAVEREIMPPRSAEQVQHHRQQD